MRFSPSEFHQNLKDSNKKAGFLVKFHELSEKE